MEFLLFQFVLIAFCPITGHHGCKSYQTGITYLHVQQWHQSSPAEKGLGAFIRESSRYILNRAIINLLPDPKVRKIIHLCCYWLNNKQ